MSKDQVMLDLLVALIDAWTEQMTPVNIGSDPEKIKLLKNAKAHIDQKKVDIPNEIREVYRGVFFSDIWE